VLEYSAQVADKKLKGIHFDEGASGEFCQRPPNTVERYHARPIVEWRFLMPWSHG
jgi:hypothetical protein